MKQITTFEGWLDEEPNWEFDMPVYMVNPIMGYVESGNEGGIDYLIEEYFITLFLDEDQDKKAIGSLDEYPCQVDEEDIRRIKLNFNNAKKERSRRGIYYWKRVVEWDDQDINYGKVLEDIKIGK